MKPTDFLSAVLVVFALAVLGQGLRLAWLSGSTRKWHRVDVLLWGYVLTGFACTALLYGLNLANVLNGSTFVILARLERLVGISSVLALFMAAPAKYVKR